MEEVKEEKKILDASRRTTLLYSAVVPMEIEKKNGCWSSGPQ